nr:phytoene desaturase [Bacilli bacterium]
MKVVIIGAGLAGLATAISLAAKKHDVTILEQGPRVGGKLNLREHEGFQFDTGPSILTMPWVLEKLYQEAGRNLADYLTLVRVKPEWRGFWPDGSTIDMDADFVKMHDAITTFGANGQQDLLAYLDHAKKLYDLTEKGFYSSTIRHLGDLRKKHSLRELLAMNPTRSVHQNTQRYFRDEKLQQLFDFLVMYVGSSPYDAPAVLSQLGHVQLGLGVWYVEGGLYQIARAHEKLLQELGVTIHLNTKIAKIETKNDQAVGVLTEEGEHYAADAVVCNLEAITAWRTLLKDHPKREAVVATESKFSPSVSGLVFLLGVDRQYEQLAHHNFFFSKEPQKEFDQVFHDQVPADDPTIYIGVSARSDPTQAPQGKDNLFVLTHVPPLLPGETFSTMEKRYREIVMKKLMRMGLTDLDQHVQWSYTFTPDDLHALYGANGGSIYGVVSDRKKNGGFKIANESPDIEHLYFVGGSTHPGGGVPMVTLSGLLTAQTMQDRLETAVRR